MALLERGNETSVEEYFQIIKHQMHPVNLLNCFDKLIPFENIESQYFRKHHTNPRKETAQETLQKFTDANPCSISYQKISNLLHDCGHLAFWRSFIDHFMYHSVAKKNCLLQYGFSKHAMNMIQSYIKDIFHCIEFDYQDN